MKRKSKLFLSIASMMFAVALLCFGVYAALSVSYTISGSVAYEVKDAFVEIKTKVYGMNQFLTEDEFNAEVPLFLEQCKQYDMPIDDFDDLFGTPTQEFEAYNTLTGTGEASASNIEIDYNKNYVYVIVINVKNLSSDNYVHASISNNIENQDNLNSLIKYSSVVSNITKPTSGENYGKNMAIFFALKDATLTIDSMPFDFDLNVNATTEKEEDLSTKFTFTSINNNSEWEISANSSYEYSGDLIIPSTYLGKPVTRIADANIESEIPGSFAALPGSLGKLSIPSSVKEIGSCAFMGTSFSSIEFNEGLEVIEDGAFMMVGLSYILEQGWSGYDIKLPNSLKSLGSGSLAVAEISNLYIGSSLQHIGENALNPYAILALGVPQNIEVSPENIYYTSQDENGNELGCVIEKTTQKLVVASDSQNFTQIPDGVKIIGKNSLEGIKLSELIIPNSVTTLEQYSLNVYNVNKLVIPSSVTSLPDGMIGNTTSTVIIQQLEIHGVKDFSSVSQVFQPVSDGNEAHIYTIVMHDYEGKNIELLDGIIKNINDLQMVYVPSEYVQELTDYYASVYTQEGYNGNKPNFVAIA